ncbi:MAG TPA: hypothetical protein VJB90_02590 [Candidatus Nanoarchaeia archaeon]|nr:hypothetical protein [Candidatus Nanoarchaeia archaeon]
MPSKSITGGEKEFVYTKEDLKRIEGEETESTKEFKKALEVWYEKNNAEKLLADRKRKLLLQMLTRIGLAVLGVAIVLLIMRMFVWK